MGVDREVIGSVAFCPLTTELHDCDDDNHTNDYSIFQYGRDV